MANKRRLVDVLSPVLKFKEEDKEDKISFIELLEDTNKTEFSYAGGSVELKLINIPNDDSLSNCKIGILTSTQDRDVPPKKNKRTGILNPVDINPETEGLAYGNVFIYDPDLNVIIYEINKNGCFIDKFKLFLYQTASNNKKVLDISFSTIARKGEYERLQKLSYFKKVTVELRRPEELLKCFDEENDSMKNSLLAKNIESSANSNSETIKIEQIGLPKKKNSAGTGIKKEYVQNTIDAARIILANYQSNVSVIEVKGYAIDVENPRRIKTINLITDVFNEWFSIPDIQIQSDIQEKDRVDGIIFVYKKILQELKQILG
ncbi:MAG: hypothetical protein ACK5MH_04105 [Bacteroidales bacterium]